MAPVIQAKRLTQELGRGARVLSSITFEVAAGETYALLGSAGSGKSTLVGIVRSAIRPTSGQALISGKNCTTEPLAVRREAVFITPHSSLFSMSSARSNVKYLCRIAGAESRADDSAIDNAFRRVGLPERAFDMRLQALGREGHVQTWLAIALLRSVSALILEEPSHAIDQSGQRPVLEAIQECRDAGMAVLIVTSDIAFASVAGDVVGVLEAGMIQSEHSRVDFGQRGLAELVKHGVGFVDRPARA
jgi:ABC-type multidrug transport system ATPase subunit